jgi:hypothetical protein
MPQERAGDFSMKNLKRKEAVAVESNTDDEQDFDDMPFMPRKKVIKK